MKAKRDSIMTEGTKTDLVDKFEMAVGGVLVIGGAVVNSLVVRPLQRLFSAAAGAVGIKRPQPQSSFTNDIMPLECE